MELLILSIVYMILFFLAYKLYYGIRARKNKKVFFSMIEMAYLVKTFNLDIEKIGIKKLFNIVVIANALIFTITLITTASITNMGIRILVMFIMLFPLIYTVYYVIGKYYQKKGMIKNV